MIWEFTISGKMNGVQVERHGQLIEYYQDNIACFKSTDDKKPIYFFAKNVINDEKLIELLLNSWRYNQKCPKTFSPQRTLLTPILDNLDKMSTSECFRIIDALRKQKVLPPIRALTKGTQPYPIDWSEVSSLCII